MLDISVLPPNKTDSLYEFSCIVRVPRSRIGGILSRTSALDKWRLRFGYRAQNYGIRHHEIWDGFYPLFALTRQDGPLFDTSHKQARIRFTYPISPAVRDFFIQRAADNGIHIDVEAELKDMRLDQRSSGDVVAFGGGKDSRLILGMLRERELEPTVIAARGEFAMDIPGVLVVKPIQSRLVDRIMPSFMHLGRRMYYGGGLGESHLVTPWHRYYDMASSVGRRQLSALLVELGVETEIRGPAVVLPYNITQRILHDRYPELYAGQISTKADVATEKNLHVALLKLYHDLPYTDRIGEPLFRELLQQYVAAQLADPADFGARNHREVINREMRAIIWRRRDDAALSSVRDDIPPQWDGAWIDYIHTYAEPDLDAQSLDVFRQYAQTVDEVDPATSIRRFPV